MSRREDRQVIVCWTVAELEEPAVKSDIELCEECGEPIWVAPSSREFRARVKVEIITACYHCAREMMAQEPPDEVGIMPLRKEQLEEILEYVKMRQEKVGLWVGKRVRIVEPRKDQVRVAVLLNPEHIGKEGTIIALVGDWVSPKIELDDGSIVYGYECWWEPIGWSVREGGNDI